MKIIFDDGSFLELGYINKEDLRIVLGAKQGYNKTTMVSVDLTDDQVQEIINFLTSSNTQKSS